MPPVAAGLPPAEVAPAAPDVPVPASSSCQSMVGLSTPLGRTIMFQGIGAPRTKVIVCVGGSLSQVGMELLVTAEQVSAYGTFESMAESLRGGLSLTLSGFGFWSHDIGGFEHTAPPAVYKRWIAFGLLSSHSRLHGNSSSPNRHRTVRTMFEQVPM